MLALKGSEGGNIGGQCDHISLGKYVELWKISIKHKNSLRLKRFSNILCFTCIYT